MKKQCSYCVFTRVQLTDDKSDVDFEKSWICIKDAYKITTNIKDNMFWIDEKGENMEVLGYEKSPEDTCEHFIKADE